MSKVEYEKFLESYSEFLDKNLGKDEKTGKEKKYNLYGPITEKYWDSYPKIAVFNLESYNDDYIGVRKVDIEIIKGWIGNRTIRNTGTVVAGIFNGYENSRDTRERDLREFRKKTKNIQSSLEKISYLNFRVTDNLNKSKRVDRDSIWKELKLTKDYLRKQISILKPDIILVGGRDGADMINYVLNLEPKLKFSDHIIHENMFISSFYHFSGFGIPFRWYFHSKKKINEILEFLKVRGS